MRRTRSQAPEDFDAVDVLLVEDDDEDVAADEVRTVLHELALEAMTRRATWPGDPQPLPDAEATVPGPAPGLVRRAARRYRRQAVTGAVLIVAVTATTAVVDARQSAAREAALAASPAVLTQASTAPAEVWRVPGRVVSDQDDALLVVDGASLQALDPATGEAIWTASAAAGRAASTGGCFPVDEGRMPDRAPVDGGAGPRGLVACTANAPAGTSQGDTTAGARVVVIDSATGRTRHTLTADGALLLAEPVGRDLLVVEALTDSRVRITRWNLATGTPQWDSVSALPVLTGGLAEAVERRPDSLTVGAFAVDLATGEELDAQIESGKPHPYEEHALPDGARATWSWQKAGTSGRGRVSGGDAGSSFLLTGPPLRPSITDGSAARVLVLHTIRAGRLRALDLRTGRMKWSEPYPATSVPRATALVDGVMLLDDGATVTALDVGTGHALWRAPVDGEATAGAALTDGQVVLLPVRVDGGADDGILGLVAHRIADGTVVWRTDAPPGTVSMTVVRHHLVASTDDEVIGLA